MPRDEDELPRGKKANYAPKGAVIKTDWRPDPEGLDEVRQKFFGRPPEYDPAYCELVVLLGTEGFSQIGIQAKLGRSNETWNRWRREHQELKDAFELAHHLSQAFWEEKGALGMFTPGFSAATWIFHMKNRFRDVYKDRHEHSLGGATGDGSPIELTGMNYEQRQERIAELLRLRAADEAAKPAPEPAKTDASKSD